jgi:hypothetical protein
VNAAPLQVWGRRYVQGSWEAEPTQLSNMTSQSSFRDGLIAGAQGGKAVVLWGRDDRLPDPDGQFYYVRTGHSTLGEAWVVAGNVFNVHSDTNEALSGLDFAMDGNGNGLAVLGHESLGILRPRYALYNGQTGAWLASTLFEGVQPPMNRRTNTIIAAMDDADGAVAMWETGSGNNVHLVSSRYKKGSGFSPAVALSAKGASGTVSLPKRSLVSSGARYLTAFMQRVSGVDSAYAAQYDVTTETWGAVTLLSDGLTSITYPTVSLNAGIDQAGNGLVTWVNATTFRACFARYDASGETWSTPAPLVAGETSHGTVDLVVAENGVAAAILRTGPYAEGRGAPLLSVFE